MGITKTTREKLEDAFFDMNFDDQGRLLESLHTLHRMKKRQPGDTPAAVGLRHMYRHGSVNCFFCGGLKGEAIPGQCPGKSGQPEQQRLGHEVIPINHPPDCICNLCITAGP